MKAIANRNKGISLIVLVVTIIIMIILSTAVILSLNSSDIVGKARQSKSSDDIANAKELVATAYAEWMLKTDAEREETIFSEYAEQKLTSAGYNTTGEIVLKVTDSGNIVPVPAGFTASIYQGENTVEGGFVIYEINSLAGVTQGTAQTTYNQFVWVPVEGTFERIPWRKENLQNAYVEPLTENTAYLDATTVLEHSAEIEQYNNMKESVGTYGGFYIGRYEAGKEGTNTLVSKKNAIVWNSIVFDSTWDFDWKNRSGIISSIEYGDDQQEGCAKIARDAYAGLSSVTSSLLYGVQWDTALKFIDDEQHSMTNSTSWGNHINNVDRNSISPNRPAKTGSCENWKVKNIYDMAGNVWEWTYEAYTGNGYGRRVLRGGDYDDAGFDYSASSRCGNVLTIVYCGFRVQLFLK